MDDLFQLIIFVVIALVAVLGSGKKKKPPAAQRRVPHPEPPDGPTPAAGEEPEPVASAGEDFRRELLDLLQGRPPAPKPPPAPTPEPEPEPEPIALDAYVPRVQSIESLDPEGSATHRAFHEKFVDRGGMPEQPPDMGHMSASLRRLTPRTAREAVIWKAIFDKPKGLL